MPMEYNVVALTFQAFITLLSLSLALAVNTVGKGCTSNSTCTGVNEYCQEISWLSPSCASGMCQCLPCFTTGDFSGYSWAPNPCAPEIHLQLGDECRGSYNEMILAKNAECSNGVVVCKPYFFEIGSDCTRLYGLVEGEPCRRSVECAGDLWCGLDQKCECYYSYERYDAKTGDCVKKSLGDYCNIDDDCKVSGRNWNGFTWSSAFCVNEACDCGWNTKTVAAYIDGKTGALKKQEICITAGGVTNLKNGSRCSVDPVYYGDSSDVQVCDSNHVCFSCPEDSDWTSGKCRKLVGSKPIPYCLLRPSSRPSTVEAKSSELTSVEVVNRIETTVVVPTQQDNNVIAISGNSVGKVCNANTTCRGLNEYCQSVTWLRPSCSDGMCQCLPCHLNDPLDRSKPCMPMSALSLGDVCNNAYFEVMTVAGAECYNGRVMCKPGFDQDGSNKCVAQGNGVAEGGFCQFNFQCSGEMICANSTCRCKSGFDKFDPKSCECVHKGFGDRCSQDDDCKFTLGAEWNSYDGVKNVPAVCAKGYCDCNPKGYKKIVGSYIEPQTGGQAYRFLCVSAGTTTDVALGGQCSIDPAFSSSVLKADVRACQSDHVCFSCPEDNVNSAVGNCRQVVDTMPVPACYKAPKCDDEDESSTTAEQTTTSTTTTTTTTTTEAVTVATAKPATAKRESCLDSRTECGVNEECVTSFCGTMCRCMTGFAKNGAGVCSPVIEVRLGHYCDQFSENEIYPPHSICEGTVKCNSYYRETNKTCVKIPQGGHGSLCGPLKPPCIVNEKEDLWCDDATRTCSCYESRSFKWNADADLCVKREFGDVCSADDECAVYGSLTSGGYTYGGGICQDGKCACSPKFIPTSLTFVSNNSTGQVASKTICVHRSSRTNLAAGQPCTLDPVFYGDNPLGQTRVCRRGLVCVRCENDPNVARLILRQGICRSPV